MVFLMVRRTDKRFVKMGVFCSQVSSFVEEVSNAGSPEHLPHAHTCINKLVLHRCSDQSRRMFFPTMLDVTSQGLLAGSHVVHLWVQCGPGTLQKGNCVKSCCMRCPQKAFNLLRHQCQQCVKRSEIDEQAEPCEIPVKRTEISEHCCARYRNTLLPSRKGRSFGPSEAA